MQLGSYAYGAVELGGEPIPIVIPAPPAQQRFTLFIAGVDRSTLMIVNTLKISNALSQASTCNFMLRDGSATFRPTVGQDIQVFSNATKVFGGLVTEVDETAYQARKDILVSVRCSDYSVYLDRRIVAGFFPSQVLTGLTTIVSSLVWQYLQADGIIYNSQDGDPGITLGDQLFNWVTARQAFNQLSSLTGWEFQVDYNKMLRFFPPGTALGAAPFNIHDNDGNWLTESMTVKTLSGIYANRVYVRSSSQATPLWAEIFSKTQFGSYPSSPQPPGGGRIVFITQFPINEAPIIKVNSVQVSPARVITLAQVAGAAFGSYDWYWIPGGDGVFQNQANAPLGVNDILEIDYQTKLSPATVQTCKAQVAARASAEGNSGYYDAVFDAPNITEPVALALYATAVLNRYGCTNGLQVQILFSTIKDGLFVGQSITINTSSPLAPNNTYLITQIQAADVDKDHLKYDVTCDLGNYFGNLPAQFFAALVNRGQLPQPANRQTYTWAFAMTQSGVANPGISSTGTYPFVHICQHPEEVVQYLSVAAGTGPANNTVQFELLINNTGTVLFVQFVKGLGNNTELRCYNPPSQPPMIMHAGDIMAINVSLNSDAAMKDVNVTVVTSVVVT